MNIKIGNYLSITKKHYIKEGSNLNILLPSEVRIKEATNDYVAIESSLGITEVKENGLINLYDSQKEITIKKVETKKVTLPLIDYTASVIIKY